MAGSAKDKYNALSRDRSGPENRAERAARVTIPSLFPPEGHNENSKLPTPYQSLGARAVNTLAAKITLALFPPNTSFFRLNFDEVTQALLKEDSGIDLEEAQKNLSLLEQIIVTELEQSKLRPVLSEAARHLLTVGNGTLGISRDGEFRFFDLRSYVVSRDPEGNIQLFIAKEEIAFEMLGEDQVEEISNGNPMWKPPEDPEDTVEVYTIMRREGDTFEVVQEIEEVELESTRYTYPAISPPFIVMRWTSLPGEDYGRGLVDDYYGDFAALDDLSRDLLDASSASAKVVLTVDPNGTLTPRKVRDAKSGDVLSGNAETVDSISIDKLGDFQVVLERINFIAEEIRKAFLMHSSVQRDAERVTAEEVRYMASELEDALGGVYSLLSQEVQAPMVRRFVSVLARKDRIPELPQNELRLRITTGVEALGRSHEVQKLMAFLGQARNILGEQALGQRLDVNGVLDRLASGIGISTEGLIRSDEQVEQVMNAESQRRMAEQSAPGVSREVARSAVGEQRNG
jgi:hypothetical protein